MQNSVHRRQHVIMSANQTDNKNNKVKSDFQFPSADTDSLEIHFEKIHSAQSARCEKKSKQKSHKKGKIEGKKQNLKKNKSF